MNLPSISAICCTYGRIKETEESLACFLSQDYEGPKELLIVNSCPQQRLTGEFPNVRIINLPQRPGTLGEKRNISVEYAKGDVCCVWDSDDLFASNFLSVFAKHFTEDRDWVWLNRQFYSEQGKIKAIVQGTMNVLAFRKSAWAAIGGYTALTVGEDRQFVATMTSTRLGVKVAIPDEDIAFIYCWGNGVYHCSGLGDDAQGRPSAHDRVEQDLRERIRKGDEPTGTIQLQPSLSHDPAAMVQEFRQAAGEAGKQRAIETCKTDSRPPYTAALRNPLPKITLVYVYVPGDPEHADLAARFSSSYTACPPGVPHETMIVCNGKWPDAIAEKLLAQLPNCRFVQHDDSGWDIGAFIVAAKKMNSDLAVFCGGKTHFRRGGWMTRMVEAWQKHGEGFYGSLASYEVSPHINTSGFWCNPSLLRRYPKAVTTRQDRYNFEHGPLAMWRAVVKDGKPSLLVTWDNEYAWPEWRKPENGFRRGDQSNCLTYFEHTNRFDAAAPELRLVMTASADTITDSYFLEALRHGDSKLSDAGNNAHFLKAHNFR